jgi:hypothetical protein
MLSFSVSAQLQILAFEAEKFDPTIGSDAAQRGRVPSQKLVETGSLSPVSGGEIDLLFR